MNHVAAIACAITLMTLGEARAGDPWADSIIAFEPGNGSAPGFDDPTAALGEPSRMTGFASTDAEAVTPFNAPYNAGQIVSLGAGGVLTVQFDEPVEDDPANPFGIDLIVFGNTFFASGGSGICGSPCGAFTEGGMVEVSADGETWHPLPGMADGLWPTNGWADLSDPFSVEAGVEPANFTRPVDPALALADFDGLDYSQIQALYDGSGGGAGFDIAPTGLAAISYVRITNPEGFDSPEIDGLADVAAVFAGDVTGDGVVDLADLLAVIGAWGSTGEPGTIEGDANDDGIVDLTDLLAVIGGWGGGA